MRNTREKNTSHRKRERGSVVAYAVLSFLFLFLAVGLGVDLSHLYLAKTELQNTADSAALAGASALTQPSPGKITTAVDRAVQIMNSNRYNFDKKDYVNVMSLAGQRALVEFAKNLGGPYVDEATAFADPDDMRFVRVRTPTVAINMFFSVLLLGATQGLDAVATAGLSIPGNVNFCIAPLSAIQCDAGDPNCTLCDPNEPGYPNCTTSKYFGVCPGADPYAIQTYTIQTPNGPVQRTCDPKKEFCKRCTYVIRAEGQGGGGPAAGNYQILRCAGNGDNEVKQALAEYGTNCRCGSVSPGGDVETQTGVGAGPVRFGLNVRFDDYQGGLTYGPNMVPDSNIAYGTSSGQGTNQTFTGISFSQYQGTPAAGETSVTPIPPSNPHLPGVAGRRVLIMPIIPVSEWQGQTGNSMVTIGSIGGFFMKHPVGGGSGGDIAVEYIEDEIASVIGYDPNNNTTSNVVTPVLYR